MLQGPRIKPPLAGKGFGQFKVSKKNGSGDENDWESKFETERSGKEN